VKNTPTPATAEAIVIERLPSLPFAATALADHCWIDWM
jgi:hypothetical protein